MIPNSVHDDVERLPNWPLLLEQAWSWGCRRAGRSGAPAPRVEAGKLRSIAYAPRTRFERAIAEHRQSAAQRRGCPTADKGALRCIRISASASGQSPEYHTLEIQRASIERTARNHGHELVDVLTAEDQSGRTRNPAVRHCSAAHSGQRGGRDHRLESRRERETAVEKQPSHLSRRHGPLPPLASPGTAPRPRGIPTIAAPRRIASSPRR